MSKDFLSAIANRRTYYAINKDFVVSDDKVKEVIDYAVTHTPSAFNSQSARVVLLLGDHHDKLWEYAKDALRKIVPAEQFPDTEDKINSFKAGYGTVLFFEDNAVVEGLQERFSLYKDNFPVWSQQSNGMLQLVVWTALEAEGFGASLQHYSELIDADVKKEWNLPHNWKFIGQMPFGKPTAPPSEKPMLPLDVRVKVFK